jgi:hypothetical protein
MIYVAIFLLNVLDLLTTHLAVNVLQVATEGNPFMAPIVGSWLIIPVKLLGACLMVYIAHRARTKYPQWKVAKGATLFALMLYILIVINNSLTIIAEVYFL